MPPYSLLGRFYDQLTRGAPDMNRHARKKILGRLLPKLKVVCDLGCGSGTTAIELARAGHKVYAVDRSPAQCRQARQKIQQAGVNVRLRCADMQSLRLPEPVDLILCEFNPVNHLPRKDRLKPAFRKVAQALRPGGWFYFDLNMQPTYAECAAITRWEEHDGFCLVMRGKLDAGRQMLTMELDWFIAEGGRWRRYRERIQDTWWTDEEVRLALRGAGFGKIRAWDGTRIRPAKIKPRRGYDRYYLAQRVA